MMIFLEGLMLGFAYVVPIGAQNLFVIQSSVANRTIDAFKVTSLVILMDISLALACYYGIGSLISKYPYLASVLQVCGGVYLLKISISLLVSKSSLEINNKRQTLFVSARSAFVLTWMNPQALVDGSILLGSFNGKLGTSNLFIVGVCLASIIWFYTLTIIMRAFRNSLNDKKLRIINVICGVILLYLGFSLLIDFARKAGIL